MSLPSAAGELARVEAQGARSGQILAEKYRIERLIGRGGMGEVYEARHLVVGRRFAIKFLQERRALASDSSRRFLFEARAAGALDSEHIAAVLDFDTAEDGAPFLVMEYLSGESLAKILAREGCLPVPRALDILLQVADGLAVAHEAGIVHRDLKPDNLFVVPRANASELVKILDFGVAKLMGEGAEGGATHSGAVLGTPFYMAPEQARGEKTVDRRVDIYALGVIAYELLSGVKPHPGAGYNAILAHILTERVIPLCTLRPDVPSGLATVIERALAFEPAARQGSIAELAAELAPFAGREVSARDSQFDLRRDATVAGGAATLASSAGSLAPGESTLGSAVGSLPRSAQVGRLAGRSPWLLAAFVALLAASLARALHRSESPAVHDVPATSAPYDTTAAAAVSKASPTPEPSAPAAPASEVAPRAPLASSPTPPALPPGSAKTKLAAPRAIPSSDAARPPTTLPSTQRGESAASEVHFDEKNPY